MTSAGERAARGVEGDAPHRPLSFERAKKPPAINIPQLDFAAITPTGKRAVCESKGDASHPVFVPFQRVKQPATGRLPELDRTVLTRAGEGAACRIKGDIPNLDGGA